MNWKNHLPLFAPADSGTGTAPAESGATPAPGASVPQPSALSAGATEDRAGGTPATGALAGEAGATAGDAGGTPAASGEGGGASALDQGDDFGADAAPAAEAPAPLTVEALELGEDHGYDPETLNEFLGFMNDPELDSAGRAKAMLGLADKLLVSTFTQVQEQAVKQWTDTQNEWRGQIRQLEGFGEKTPQRLGEIKRGLMAAGADKTTFDALNVTGAGNHPAIIKMLDKLAKPFLERPSLSGGPVREGKSLEDKFSKLFPSTQSKD